MKLHLPPCLFRSLLAAIFAVASGWGSLAYAGVMHSDVSIITYTDFGQNMGRYKAEGTTNALLDYLREQDGGVLLSYTGGQESQLLPHEMIDFSSQNDGSYGAAIGYNWYVTVQHNAVHNNTYTGNNIGSSNAIYYVGIEYRTSEDNKFLYKPSLDYKATRQSKLITDVTGSTIYGSVNGDYSTSALKGELLYRAGSGGMSVRGYDGVDTSLTGGYRYIIGGVGAIGSISDPAARADGAFSASYILNCTPGGINESAPLPYRGAPGDSGSPSWVWNEATQQYEFLGAMFGGSTTGSIFYGASEYTVNAMEHYNKTVAMEPNATVYINGVTTQADTAITDSVNNVSTTPWSGTVTDAAGNELQSFIGVQSGINTWNDLSGLKDTDNWFSYGASYLNSSSTGEGKGLNYADLFMTENLVFQAGSAEGNKVIVNADVDLGIGYVQFSKGEQEHASFILGSAEGSGYQLNSAGYVVDGGVDLHLQFTGAADYMREWRKIGDGNLYIEGSGDNNILLNLGGDGATYLNREGGYAAYNVLANNGTTVVVSDANQIYRDFTFGYHGGVLDMNGASMEWNNDNAPSDAGFTIHALDEYARITNGQAGTTTTLTWTQGGDQTWLGSFCDTAEGGALKFVYNGGAGSTLTMHGIYTSLTQEGSGMAVQSGTLKLEGTLTVHGKGSVDGRSAARLERANDWHYADIASDIEVQNGGTLELGSHVRLTGDVTVKAGGAYVMREGVQSRYEYIEGGQTLEDTYAISAFYGHHGNTALEAGSVLQVSFSEGTTANTTCAGNITGAGSMVVDTGDAGGSLTLSGANDFSGAKEVQRGILVAANEAALGDTTMNKWVVGAEGQITTTAEEGYGMLLEHVDGASTGTLLLLGDQATAVDMSGHASMTIGALAGSSIHYGTADQSLAAVNGQWVLGGGGGELIVDFRLDGANDLVLGNEQTKGSVYLANTGNTISGNVIFKGGVTLDYVEGALDNVLHMLLGYTDRVIACHGADLLDAASLGAVLVDKENSKDIDLSGHQSLAVGTAADTTYYGSITLAAGQAYRFGATSATLNVQSLLSGAHDIVVDGHTYAGGRVVLGNISADWQGKVSIMGYDAAQSGGSAEGNITLAFSQQNALAQAFSVEIREGGTLDLAGTVQTVRNLQLQAGGQVVDSSVGGILQLVGTGSVQGGLNVSQATSSGNLSLGGTNAYGNLTIDGGMVTLASDTALSAAGVTTVAMGGVLDAAGHTLQGAVRLSGGSVDASAGLALASGSSLLAVGGKESTLYLSDVPLAYEVGAEKGSTLKLSTPDGVDSFSIAEMATKMNTAGGAISVGTSEINLLGTVQRTFNGTLLVDQGEGSTATLCAVVDELASSGKRGANHIDRVEIGAGSTLVITEKGADKLGGSAYLTAATWSIHELAGSGTIRWESRTNQRVGMYAQDPFYGAYSRLLLDAESSFTGNLEVCRYNYSTNETSNNKYNSFLEVAHDRAIQNATVTLWGDSYVYAGMEINTDNAHLAGLNGNANSYLWASSSGISASGSAPDSKRAATMTVTGSGEYAFSGNVGGSGANGISLVMEGTGSQTFDGSSAYFLNVSALAGELHLNAETQTVAGSLAVAQGALLDIGEGRSFTLSSGLSFSVLQSADRQGQAVFSNALVLNGGVLSFDGGALDAERAALVTAGVSQGSALTSQEVAFTKTSYLQEGATYKLAEGDWSFLDASSVNATGLQDYLTVSFRTGADGLYAEFGAVDGWSIWGGTEEAHTWSDSVFGVQAALSGGDIPVFNDSASCKEVQVEGALSVASMHVDNEEGYRFFSGGADSSLEVDQLTKSGAGLVSLDTRTTLTGTAEIQGGRLVHWRLGRVDLGRRQPSDGQWLPRGGGRRPCGGWRGLGRGDHHQRPCHV